MSQQNNLSFFIIVVFALDTDYLDLGLVEHKANREIIYCNRVAEKQSAFLNSSMVALPLLSFWMFHDHVV